MKYVVLFFICCTSLANSQEKYWTRSGTLTFEASMPAFEEVKATNENVTAILNTTDGTFAALALVKGFRFKNALMEEHFNESYAESDSFPKAIFKGVVEGFKENNTLNNYLINVTLDFHGVTERIQNINVQIKKLDSKLTFKGNFELNPKEFDIEIPKIVSSKIADKVIVVFEFSMVKK